MKTLTNRKEAPLSDYFNGKGKDKGNKFITVSIRERVLWIILVFTLISIIIYLTNYGYPGNNGIDIESNTLSRSLVESNCPPCVCETRTKTIEEVEEIQAVTNSGTRFTGASGNDYQIAQDSKLLTELTTKGIDRGMNLNTDLNEYGIPWANRKMTINGKELLIDDIIYGYDLLFEKSRLFLTTHWMGVQLQQDPLGSFNIADIFWRTKPECLVELGTNVGGSAVFYASIMKEYNPNILIITLDPTHPTKHYDAHKLCPGCQAGITHPLWNSKYIKFIQSSSLDKNAFEQVKQLIKEHGCTKIIVMDDANHSYQLTYGNLNLYDELVPVGSYFIVQDTKMDRFTGKPGPLKAVHDFLANQGKDRYVIDKNWEYLIYSQHHDGFLYKVAE